MASIENKERAPITLPTGHVVPRLGILETDNETIRQPDNWPQLSGRALAGQITIEFDPDEDPAEPNETILQTIKAPPEPTSVLQLIETIPPMLGTPAPKPDEGLPPKSKGKTQ